jgi:hypothetical protein
MVDMSKTVEAKSDQLNADDLQGRTITIKVTGIKGTNDPQQPITISYEGDNGKPYKPCKSMRRVLLHIWGADGLSYIGKSLTLFCDPTVKFGGIAVGGIRISHMSGIDKPIVLALTASKANKKPYKVLPLQVKSEENFNLQELKLAIQSSASQGIAEYEKHLSNLGDNEKAFLRSKVDKSFWASCKEQAESVTEEVNNNNNEGEENE